MEKTTQQSPTPLSPTLESDLWERIKKTCLTQENVALSWGFWIFSILSYLYFVTNDLNNYDNISILTHGYGTGVASGRWLLQILGDFLDSIDLSFNLPFFNALTALIFLWLCGCLVVRILDIHSRFLCFSLGAITAAFPVVAATMFFSYTIQYYFFGLFLGVVGVFFLAKTGWRRLLAPVFFALSLGLYQAYYPFLAALLVLMLIRETLEDGPSWKQVLKDSFLFLGLFVLGYLLYRILCQVFLNVYQTQFNDYKGMSSMGQVALGDLPRLIKDAYKHYLRLYRLDYCAVGATVVVRICVGLSFLTVALGLILGWKKRPLLKNLELCVLLFLLPLAANSIVIMVPNSSVYTLMVFGLIALYYIPVLMVEKLHSKTRGLLTIFLSLVLLCASVNYAYQSNGNYRSLYYQNKKTENYFTVLLTQIRSTEGYTEDMEIYFVGETIEDSSLYDGWQKYVFQYGGKGSSVMSAINAYSRPDFILQYFGYFVNYAPAEMVQQYSSLIAQMPTYPNSGSIQIVDNLVLVNCG